ncbi:MAG TPA: aldose 1-epimerase family protein [Gaiella sp.]|nr:aldose 1-epimerase family protein [Gaiella sp.]
MTMPIAPSGEQVELTHGDRRAVIVEVGGGLRTYTVGGRDVLDGYAADELCTSGRGQVLLPWPNRIEDGSYEFEGSRHQLPLTEVSAGNAIHGLVRWATWVIAERGADRVVVEHVLHPQPGYPFSLALRVEYALDADGLTVRTTATNVGADACPFGSGMHPYFTLGTPTVDSLTLTVPARHAMESDPRGLPGAPRPVEGTDLDFRRSRLLGGMTLDTTFTDLERGDDGLARVLLRDDSGGTELTVWADGAYTHFQLFTGDPLPDVNRRSLAVEPMSCPANAFQTGDGVVRLEPGASWTGAWGIA